MPNGGLGGGVGMAQQARQLGRSRIARQFSGKQVSEKEQEEVLAKQGQGQARRQLSAHGVQAGAVGRGRTLKTLGGQRHLGGGLGNRSLGRFRRPQ